MSREQYRRAVEIIERDIRKYNVLGPRSDQVLAAAEDALGLHFATQYRDFLQRFGTAVVGMQEIYGVIDDDFEDSSVPDGIWYTLEERRDIALPTHLLVICDTGDFGLFCLDFNKLSAQNEPAVVLYIPGIDEEFQAYEVVAEDFGEFLMNCIEQKV